MTSEVHIIAMALENEGKHPPPYFFSSRYLYEVLNILKSMEKYKEGKKPAC